MQKKTDGFMKEQAKLFSRQMSVTGLIHKNLYSNPPL
jgi:hypothetical protein